MSLHYVDNPDTHAKFHKDGAARHHPGSTFVARVVPDSPVWNLCRRIQRDVEVEGLDGGFAYTPPASFHMTVMEGVKVGCGDREDRSGWPSWLREVEDWPTAVQRMRQTLIDAEVRAPRGLKMEVAGIYPLHERLTVKAVPASEAVTAELERFRSEASRALDMRVASLEEYKFHVTMGYRLTIPDQEELDRLSDLHAKYETWAAEIDYLDLKPTAFTIFDDMLAFPPVLYLP